MSVPAPDSPPASASIVGNTEGDAYLRGLGVVRLAIPIPFKEAGGPVNVYVIDNADGSLTLFDAGLGTDEAEAALLRGFEEAGKRPEDVREIVVSHGHVDHFGAAKTLVARSGAKVRVHPADAEKLTANGRLAELAPVYVDYFVRLGVPEERAVRIMELAQGTGLVAHRLDEVGTIEEGERLRFRHFEAEVMHLPGHTPGLICLHAPEHKLFFADDHLLARVSPNPLIELGPEGEAAKFRALPAYFRSVERIRGMELEWILPGHGAPFRDHRGTIDSLFSFYGKRQEKMLKALATRPMTAYELVAEVFGEARSFALYLMLSEVVGNLEVLEDRGAVRRIPGELPYRYAPAA